MFIHDSPAAFYGRGIKISSDILEKWLVEFKGSADEFQRYLLEQTFDNPMFVNWSLRIRYREVFIKTVVKWAEQRDNTEVNSRWYELISDLASRSSCEQDWCHSIYILDNNESIVLRQSTAMVSHGLTGLSSWPASICLGDYLMNRKHLLDNKRILELGAGSGLLGLALLKYSNTILSYTFTDYSPMILNLLRQNALLNFSENELTNRLKIEELDWNQFSTDDNAQDHFDVILAADVVYDPSVIESLVKTIGNLLRMNSHCCAYIANAIRNESTYDQFRQTLKLSSLNIQVIANDASQSIEIVQLTV